MPSFWPLLLGIGGTLVAMWATVKYLILSEMRVDTNVFKTLYKVGKNTKRTFEINEDFLTETKYPLDFTAFYYLKDAPYFILSHSERLLQAGFTSKDYVSKLICLRWKQGKLKQYLHNKLEAMQLTELGIAVELLTPYYTDKIGSLKMDPPIPFTDSAVYSDFEEEIVECLSGKINKTGALFYGPPGNGKTFLIKYLALKYKLPIRLVTFTPEFSNHDLMLLFSQITPKSIILFEDFDNYFDGRNCIMGTGNMNIKFTFDAILNGLDGIYNTYKENIFIMTVNDIDKVDYALKNRPSRFKFLRKIDNPNLETRLKLLPSAWANGTDGMNLDQIFVMKKFYESGISLQDAIEKTIQKVDDEKIKNIAQKRYEERVKLGVVGTPEDDWAYAQRKLGVPVATAAPVVQEGMPVIKV